MTVYETVKSFCDSFPDKPPVIDRLALPKCLQKLGMWRASAQRTRQKLWYLETILDNMTDVYIERYKAEFTHGNDNFVITIFMALLLGCFEMGRRQLSSIHMDLIGDHSGCTPLSSVDSMLLSSVHPLPFLLYE